MSKDQARVIDFNKKDKPAVKAKIIQLKPKDKFCTKCGKKFGAMDSYDDKCHACLVEELVKEYPDVPSEIYDIEASPEVVDMWYEMYGY